jgi:hypothetical protein
MTTLREALKLALDALGKWSIGYHVDAVQLNDLIATLEAALEQPEQEKRLWLWKNFVDGKPEYWAFDNAFPTHLDCGDPQTLGEPCGYAIFKPSRQGRSDISDEEVLLRIKQAQPEQEKYKLCSHGYYQDSEGNMQAGEIPDEMLSLTATRLSQVVQAVGPSEQPEQEQQAEVQALMKMQSELQRERDYWEEEARRYAGNADFWKNKHEQPEQEPVAWLYRDHNGQLRLNEIQPRPYFAFPVYTHPPRREWRGLTDEVIADLWHQNGGFHHHFARAVERWLRGG